jgi:hypothetical protein
MGHLHLIAPDPILLRFRSILEESDCFPLEETLVDLFEIAWQVSERHIEPDDVNNRFQNL